MTEWSSRLIDFDAHYYEPDDCFTRHIESAYRDRTVRVDRNNAADPRLLFGNTPLCFQPSPLDRMVKPGGYADLMLGKIDADPAAWPLNDTSQPLYRDRATRLKIMDEQGVQASVLYPSLGMEVEHDCHRDADAVYASFRSFNRWIEDDWGFDRDGRLFAAAYLSFADPERAVTELDRVLKAGARLVVTRPGPLYGRSPASPEYDGLWGRLEEAGIPLVYHIAATGYDDFFAREWGEKGPTNLTDASLFHFVTCFSERPMTDTLVSLFSHQLFERFPDLKIVVCEYGSTWVAPLLAQVDAAIFARSVLGEAPIGRYSKVGGPPLGEFERSFGETMRRNLFVTPWAHEVAALVETLGSDQVLLGSDFPHPEGVPEPAAFAAALQSLPEPHARAIARDNAARLLQVDTNQRGRGERD